jgi:hypothetical protein
LRTEGKLRTSARLLLRRDDTVEKLGSTCTVVGLLEEWQCNVAECELVPGDTLAIYTDGLTESFNEAGEEFGEERLTQAAALSTATIARAAFVDCRRCQPVQCTGTVRRHHADRRDVPALTGLAGIRSHHDRIGRRFSRRSNETGTIDLSPQRDALIFGSTDRELSQPGAVPTRARRIVTSPGACRRR